MLQRVPGPFLLCFLVQRTLNQGSFIFSLVEKDIHGSRKTNHNMDLAITKLQTHLFPGNSQEKFCISIHN